ncbi:hypothetical protein CLV41_105260 [Roseibium marinum]|uniref:Uncharacterized protein n=1 Tax=Roseibium marinum TaxID=281252 RepID=A0A2S3UU34_9HYPH|nr:hypothetical protein CLV41_105260 [Roseibium marinum]
MGAGTGYVELWIAIVAIALGAVSSLRIPALVFALIVFGALCVYIVTRLFLGDAVLQVIWWAIVYEFAFEGGYVAGHVLRYIFRSGERKRSGMTAGKKTVPYTAEQSGTTKS